ncbi:MULTISPECIES: high-affinity branched-chain amino acid ABC transporter permease LivM [Stappiaceae]|jgi:branched-chain amino acid transport system permease protein|uniref:Leucine/isoleucine/valine transporter permease subunit n=2 Tax=Roseibium TaxID=150830 RepID=A0A0M6Y4L2_9HYPH|nr:MULTISPECIES: high-affinity branched-chain amino acid ABC transporter permease LivM [Stappiaceae]MCR9283468.1 high-affinity branched-chain amino acid ABC transporter permease LivM [Paracoccaceae bacterium]MEC9401062.1 high-affinity branched-chain amino acid ABC transporter permease LivM [Pseudomonadota bacterium]AMN55376.1 ABC transporter permease [Labrenzia sp. CP4]AQQ04000.1 branched-chain amino acid ABC transporter permease [Roseibium aggregatum]MBN8183063.1 high-affinity branched-chain 
MSAKSENLFMVSLKDAAAGGAIALALFGVLIGMKAEVASGLGGQLGIEYRWAAVAIAVAIVFGGRLLLNLFVWKADKPVTETAKGFLPSAKPLAKLGKFAMPVFLILAVVLPFLLMSAYGSRGSRQYLDLAILVTTYVMLGWGLNIVVGLAGLLDLGYVAFYAVGAYSYALLAQYFGFSFWICLPLAGILAAFWGIILGFPVLRLRGDYLAIVTLAFGEIIRVVLLNWYDFTGGPDGISGIPRPSFFGIEFERGPGGFADTFGLEYNSIHRIIFLYYLILIMALVTNFVTMRLRKLPVGRAWEALREDEIACRSLGINTTNTKLTAFALGAMFGGFAGSFFATRQGFISPESFTFIESAVILAIVVLGGLGSQIGVVIAAVVMIGGFEFFRGLEEYRMLVFGLLMVVIMVWKPRGLISTRMPSITLSGKKAKGISADLVQEGHG